jgi:hypothetical protein
MFTTSLLDKWIDERFNRHQQLQGHVKYVFFFRSSCITQILTGSSQRLFVRERIQQHRDRCYRTLCRLILAEETPYTQNTHYLSSSQDKWLTIYKDKRAGKITSEPPAKKQKAANRASVAAGNPASQSTPFFSL